MLWFFSTTGIRYKKPITGLSSFSLAGFFGECGFFSTHYIAGPSAV